MNSYVVRTPNLSRRLAEFSAGVTLNQLSAPVIANTKLAILDCLGVSVLATSHELGKKMFRLAEQEGWRGPCTLWGSKLSASARDAAFVNATLGHALDYDDGGHITTYVLAAAIALAEREDVTGQSLLVAFVAGREVRMSMDILFANRFEGGGPGARGWHANGILGPIAAACSSSKILGLTAHQTLNALGLAAGSCGALGRDGGTMAKPLRAGQAAATGVTCALIAREGGTGDTEALEGSYGLFSALGPLDENTLGRLGETLGREFDWEKNKVKVKKYAAAAATHAPVEAMLRLLCQRPLLPDDVERIECHLKPFPLLRLSPANGEQGRFSMAYCLAVSLAYGRLTPEDFTDEILHERKVMQLISKVHHHSDAKSLRLVLKTGEELSEPILPVPDLQEWAEVVKKFHQCANEKLTELQRAKVIDTVAHLEELTSVRSLTEPLRISSS
jgi:2-methylcitrate dehydratase PrpD